MQILTFVTELNQIPGTFLWSFSLTFDLAYSPLNSAKLSCSSEVTLLIKGPFKEARGRNTVTQHCDATGGGSEKQKLDKLIKSSLKIKLLRRQNDKIRVIYTTIGILKCTFDLVSITTKPYIQQKILNQWICCKCLAW